MKNQNNILIVEDNASLVYVLQTFLKTLGFESIYAYNGTDGLQKSLNRNVSLILVDIGLPDISGYEIVKRVRDIYDTPIIIISNDVSINNEIDSFKNKANIFHPKPINFDLLEAQVKSLMNDNIKIKTLFLDNRFEINTVTKVIYFNKKEIPLTNNEFKFLQLLLKSRGQIVSRNRVLDSINSREQYFNLKSVDAMVCRIRKKFKSAPSNSFIETISGRGYRIKASMIKSYL